MIDGRISSKIKEVFKQILEEFKKLVEETEDKKNFVSGIIKIFTILLTSRYSSLAKLKKIIKTSAEIGVNLLPEQKQQ